MTDQETVAVNTTANWVDTVKEHAQDAWARIQESQNILFTIAVYGGIGFIVGYFLKKYAHFLAFLIILLVGISVLQQLDYVAVTINWSRIQEFCGVTSGAPDASLVNSLFDWIKANFAAAVSLAVGFLIGLRFG